MIPDTKIAVVVRADLAVWQKLNVTAFVVSGIVGTDPSTIGGEPYEDASGVRYLPMLGQPVLAPVHGDRKAVDTALDGLKLHP